MTVYSHGPTGPKITAHEIWAEIWEVHAMWTDQLMVKTDPDVPDDPTVTRAIEGARALADIWQLASRELNDVADKWERKSH